MPQTKTLLSHLLARATMSAIFKKCEKTSKNPEEFIAAMMPHRAKLLLKSLPKCAWDTNTCDLRISASLEALLTKKFLKSYENCVVRPFSCHATSKSEDARQTPESASKRCLRPTCFWATYSQLAHMSAHLKKLEKPSKSQKRGHFRCHVTSQR